MPTIYVKIEYNGSACDIEIREASAQVPDINIAGRVAEQLTDVALARFRAACAPSAEKDRADGR